VGGADASYRTFTEAGYDVDVRSPDGGPLQADGYSDPEDASGYSAHDILSLGFKKSPTHAALLQNTRSVDDVDPAGYDAIFLVGGQSPMYTFRGSEERNSSRPHFVSGDQQRQAEAVPCVPGSSRVSPSRPVLDCSPARPPSRARAPTWF
jgi:hypothetical protein